MYTGLVLLPDVSFGIGGHKLGLGLNFYSLVIEKKSAASKSVHCVSKKGSTTSVAITLSNLNRFSKFLHR